jgi:hypothetical protein
MAQKAGDSHTPSERPVGPASTASLGTATSLPDYANLPPLVYAHPPVWMRAVADLPLDKFISLNNAFARANSYLSSNELTGLTLRRYARDNQLTMAALQDTGNGTTQAFIFRPKFWKHCEIWRSSSSHPEVVRMQMRGVSSCLVVDGVDGLSLSAAGGLIGSFPIQAYLRSKRRRPCPHSLAVVSVSSTTSGC